MPKHLKYLQWSLALATVGLLGVVGAVLADEQSGDVRGEWGRQSTRLLQMDANKDGRLTRAEMEQFEAAHAVEIDSDRDGTITVDEMLAYRDKQRAIHMGEELARMDRDGNGLVSVDEFEDAQTWRLARLDRNGDGTIEPDEMRRDGPVGKRHGGRGHWPH